MIPHSNHLSGLFDCIIWVQVSQWGDGTVLFFFIHRLGLSIYCLLSKIIRNIKNPPTPPKKIKKKWNFTYPKNIPNSVPWPLETTLKCIEMTPFVMTPKNIHKIFIPQKILIFSEKTPQDIEIQNIELRKIVHAFVCIKITEYPPPSPARCVVPAQAMNSFSKLKGQDVNRTIFAVFSAWRRWYFGVVACVIQSTLSISPVSCLSPFFVGWGRTGGKWNNMICRGNPVQFCNRVKVVQWPIYRSAYRSLGGNSLYKHFIQVMADYVSPRM